MIFGLAHNTENVIGGWGEFAEKKCYVTIGVVVSIAFRRKLTLFSAIPFSRFSLKMSRFFLRNLSWKNALYALCSASSGPQTTRNQLPVLGKGNWPCDVGNISLQLRGLLGSTTRDINDSETV